MTKREATLLKVFLGAFGVIASIGGVTLVTKQSKTTGGDRSRLESKVSELRQIISEEALWKERAAWLDANAPTFESNASAASALLEKIDTLVARHGLTAEPNRLVDPDDEDAAGEFGYYQSAKVEVIVSGSTEAIVKWLHDVQSPDGFSGVDRLVLDSAEGGLRCEATVVQWYLP